MAEFGAGQEGLVGLLLWPLNKRKRHKMTKRLVKKRLKYAIVQRIYWVDDQGVVRG